LEVKPGTLLVIYDREHEGDNGAPRSDIVGTFISVENP